MKHVTELVFCVFWVVLVFGLLTARNGCSVQVNDAVYYVGPPRDAGVDR